MSSDAEHKRNPPPPRVSYELDSVGFYYKFFAKEKFIYDDVCEAKVINLSVGGAQICSKLPSLKLLKLLGSEKLYIGCNIHIDDSMLKIIARVRWAQSTPAEGETCHRMGLEFLKISEEDKALLNKFILHRQFLMGRANRREELLNPDN